MLHGPTHVASDNDHDDDSAHEDEIRGSPSSLSSQRKQRILGVDDIDDADDDHSTTRSQIPSTTSLEYGAATTNERTTSLFDEALLLAGGADLFGRQSQMKALQDAYFRAYDSHYEASQPQPQKTNTITTSTQYRSRRELVLVSGRSGTGKTALVVRTLSPLVTGVQTPAQRGKNGFFLVGKFDPQDRPDSFYPIVHAISQLMAQVKERNNPHQWKIMQQIVRRVVATDRILMDRVPILKECFDEDNEKTKDEDYMKEEDHSNLESDLDGDEVENDNVSHHPTVAHQESSSSRTTGFHAETRLVYSAVCLFRELSQAWACPLVLLLDDLQWADRPTLQFMTTAIQGFHGHTAPTNNDNIKSNNNLFVVGTCRDNEVSFDSPLAVVLRELEADGVSINNIELRNLDHAAMRDMVTTVFPMKAGQAEAFVEYLFQYTEGNAFYVVQFLRYLVDEGKLRRSGGDQWYWSEVERAEVEPSIGKDNLEDSVVSFLIEKIRKLQVELQTVLIHAACFGFEFESFLVEVVTGYENLPRLLASLRAMGYLEPLNIHRWRFIHDQTHKASSALIPSTEKEAFHLQIGRTLWEKLPRDLLDKYMFYVIEQLRLGARMIKKEDERTRLAGFLLETGNTAARSASFVQASVHLELAIELLPQRHWRENYNLSLELYMAAAEVEYCNGNFERMRALIDEVMQNCRNREDRVRALVTQIFALSSRDQLQEATTLGRFTLRELSIDLPRHASLTRLIFEYIKTKRVLNIFSDSDILRLPIILDHDKQMPIRVMNHILSASIYSDRKLSTLISLTLIQMTLREGIIGSSCLSFAFASAMFGHVFKKRELALRLANLSLSILEKFSANEWLASVSCVLYSTTFPLARPFRESLKPLLIAHRVGLGTGDIEHSSLATSLYTQLSLVASTPLEQLISDGLEFIQLAKMHHQSKSVNGLCPVVQTAMNLARMTNNPCCLNGYIMNEMATLEESIRAKNVLNVMLFYRLKLMLVCIFQKFDEAEQIISKLRQYVPRGASGYGFASQKLHEGLASLAMYNNDRRYKRKRIATCRRCLKDLQDLANVSPANYNSKVFILEGELAFVYNGISKAIRMFDESIRYGMESDLHSDVGLAAERASYALRFSRRNEDAAKYMNLSIEAYRKWGALTKVAQLRLHE